MENEDNNHEEQKKDNKSWGEEIGGAIGKGIGAEIGKEVEKNVKGENDEPKKKDKKKSPCKRRVAYIFGVFFSLLFLWIIGNFDNWEWKFITKDWGQIVDIVRYSIYLSIVMYAVFIVYDKKLFYYLGRLVMDAVSIYVSIRMYQVFPFDFKYLFDGWEWLNSVFPWVLIIAIVGISIGIIVRTGKLLIGKNIYD